MRVRRSRCLSDFWRIDASDDRVLELTSVLQGADSLVGVMGSEVRAVWSTNGESATWWVRTKEGKRVESRVFLDYLPVRDLEAPFDGRAVDEVIGYAAHEGGHCLWSDGNARDRVITILRQRPVPSSQRAATDRNKVEEVLRVANVLEDAYIDFHVAEEWPVLGEYIRWSRRETERRRPIDLDAIAKQARPVRNSMMNLWIACSLYDHDPPQRMSRRVQQAMNFLMGKSVEAVRAVNASLRLVLAVECWEELSQFPAKDEPLPRKPEPKKQEPKPKPEEKEEAEPQEGQERPQEAQEDSETARSGARAPEAKGQGEEGEGEGEEGEDGKAAEAEEGRGQDFGHFGGDQPEEGETEAEGESEGKESQEQKGGDEAGSPGNLDDFDIRDIVEMPEELFEQVMDAIAHELEDLSRSVAEVINKPVGDVDAQTKKADFDGPAAEKVRSQVEKEIQELQRVFDRQAAVQSRHLQGLTTGKLDTRRLARVATGNLRVYKRKEVLEQPDLAVGLLLDVSGSMNQHMGVVWMTAAVFSEGLIRKKGVNFLCLTYTGGYFNVQTTRICDRQMGRLCLGNVDQGGGTPSGPALASMKVLMDRYREKQRVIIHFTDGNPDDRWSVLAAVDAARKAGYQVWAIGVQGYDQMLQAQYGDGNYQTIASIRELPAKVATLVKNLVATR